MNTHDHEKAVPSPDNASLRGNDGTRIAGKDQDIAIAIVGEHRQEIDPELEARVVRKIDWFLIPTMIFGYGLVYYDKVRRSICYSEASSNMLYRQSLDLQYSSA